MVHIRPNWKLLGIAFLIWLASSGLATFAITSVLDLYHKYHFFINKFFERVV